MIEGKSNSVSLVKAIGIILMVLAHALPVDSLTWRVIYAFHMPLFFLMSGYCFKENYLTNARQFVWRKIKGIYFPFVLFSLPFLALHNVFCSWYIYEPSWIYGWKDFAWNMLRIMTRMSHNEGLLGTFWFLKELFFGNLIFYFCMKLLKGRIVLLIVGLLFLTEILCVFNLRVPYINISQNTVYAAFFIAVGYFWKKEKWQINKWRLCILVLISVFLEVLFAKNIGFLNNSALSLLYYSIPAIGCTMLVYEGCRLFGSYMPKILEIGNHTLSIMALHFTVFKVVSLCYIKLHALSITHLTEFPVLSEATCVWVLVYVLSGVSVPALLSWLWSKLNDSLRFAHNKL